MDIEVPRLPNTFQYASAKFLAFNSAAQGQGGCSLWLRRSFTKGSGQQPGASVSSTVPGSALGATSSWRECEGSSHLVVLVAHAPHSKKPAEEREAWRSRATELVEALRSKQDNLFVCIDGNARVGQPDPDEVHSGSVGQDEPNANTTPLFRGFWEALGLCLPSTFPEHQKESHTWTSPGGHRARLDFVAVPPLSLRAQVRSSQADDTVDHLLAHGNHQAV